ncbi:MAG: hypothetical protein ACI8TE_001207 [Francisella sp.]|jgi:hypothetical protein
MIGSITKGQIFSSLSFISAVVLLVLLVMVSNDDHNKEIKVTSFQNFKEYANDGRSFDYIFDVTKEPNEKIIDGVLKYSATLDNLLIKKDTIVSTAKKIDEQGRDKIVTRTFYSDGRVDFDVKVYDNQKLVEHLERKGTLNKSIFIETSVAKIKL